MRMCVTTILLLTTVAATGAALGVEVAQWFPLGVLRGHQAPVVAVAISKDGRYGASLDVDGELRRWELDTRRALDVVPLRPGAALQAGEASIALSPDGQLAAVSAPALGTVIWRPGTSPETVPVDIGAPWAPLMAISHDNTMLLTMDEPGNLRTWRTDTAMHLADYEDNSGTPHGSAIVALWFSDTDVAAGAVGLLPGTNAFEPRTGEALESIIRVAFDRLQGPDRQPYQSILLLLEVARPAAAVGEPPLAHVSIRTAYQFDDIARRRLNDHRVAIHLDLGRALYGGPSPTVQTFRTRELGDSLLTVWPYLATVLLLGFVGWFAWSVRHADAAALSADPALNNLPLPWSLRVAGVLMTVVGGLTVIDMIWKLVAQSHCWVNIAALLLLAGPRVLRRRYGWRMFALAVVWLTLLMIALLAGMAWSGAPVEFALGTWQDPLPPVLGAVVLLAVLPIPLWFLWALSNRRALAIFEAARHPDPLVPLRQCSQCGYDVRASVVAGGTACPECGQRLRYDAGRQQRIRREFEGDGPGDATNTRCT